MNEPEIAIGRPAKPGVVVLGWSPATIIVWPCGCSRTGQGAFNICHLHQGDVFDLLESFAEFGAGPQNRGASKEEPDATHQHQFVLGRNPAVAVCDCGATLDDDYVPRRPSQDTGAES